MTHIRNDRTSRQRRRAGTTLALAAASGGLLAAAMAGSPTARADDPYTDILNDVQASITAGEADYSAAATDFSTAGDTNAGLIASLVGFDNTFVSPTDYTLLGLTAAATGADFSGDGGEFTIPLSFLTATTAAGEEALASTYASDATANFGAATAELSGGNYFAATQFFLDGSYFDLVSGQADSLAGLFSLGI